MQVRGGPAGTVRHLVQLPGPRSVVLGVLDPHAGGFGGAQRVDSQQVGQGAMVHGERLGDLEEPDQLETVQSLGARLVRVDLGQPAYTAGSAGIRPSMWAKRKKPGSACIIVLTEETCKPSSPSCRMY